jgi:LAGLIDADG-like domain
MPSEVERAWAAGILDADGCVTLRPPSKETSFRHPYVVVDSTDREVLEELLTLFGGSILAKKARKETWRPQWSWRLYGARNILAFLEQVHPYMRCPAKAARTQILLTEYVGLTPRNGCYTAAQRLAKHDMEDRFLAIGHGRGASLRALHKGNDSAGDEADLISR